VIHSTSALLFLDAQLFIASISPFSFSYADGTYIASYSNMPENHFFIHGFAKPIVFLSTSRSNHSLF
jgi:hypothetical protein